MSSNEKKMNDLSHGDLQRFIVAVLFIVPFIFLVGVVGYILISTPIEIQPVDLDLQLIIIALITALTGIVSSAATFYFSSKATERAKNSG